jgi:hypothetical protein
MLKLRKIRIPKESQQDCFTYKIRVIFLKSNGLDFDNLERLWDNELFYTRAGIYLQYFCMLFQMSNLQDVTSKITRFAANIC